MKLVAQCPKGVSTLSQLNNRARGLVHTLAKIAGKLRHKPAELQMRPLACWGGGGGAGLSCGPTMGSQRAGLGLGKAVMTVMKSSSCSTSHFWRMALLWAEFLHPQKFIDWSPDSQDLRTTVFGIRT